MSPTLQWLGRLFQSANRFRSIKLSLHTKTRHIFRPKIVLSYFFRRVRHRPPPPIFFVFDFLFLLYFWLKSDLGQFKSNSPATKMDKSIELFSFQNISPEKIPSKYFNHFQFHRITRRTRARWLKKNNCLCWKFSSMLMEMDYWTVHGTLYNFGFGSMTKRLVAIRPFRLNETVGDTFMKNVRRELRPSFIYHFMN